ncbi:hypothetical protein L6164_006422 [Bauhinia variegata]|uniref:Uncharacterized protein n=1 Tax=Bauhinia variegata TaxID=167791 RepID=A0ACB9PX22_BAUVA|nr:hypothetical protein L6164_006422 [Bauhinia variegata]
MSNKQMEVEGMHIPKSYTMNGGDGPRSYTKNSSYQRTVIEESKDLINEPIEGNLDIETTCLSGTKIFAIADLGCSVGQNTFVAVQNIIEAIENKYLSKIQNRLSLEFQVLFNDHSSNDFNTLFRSLPPPHKYYAAGVPGSFYHRLFPKSSLHFVHCSYALHWMSRVPEQVLDCKSPAWDKNKVHYMNASEELHKAYSAQFKNDMESFLNARAEELVDGGLMVIVLPNQPNESNLLENARAMIYGIIESCLYEMVKLGSISQENVESFYLPLYFPSSKEFAEFIRKNGKFSIERMGTMTKHMSYLNPSVELVVRTTRAALEGLFKEQFGEEDTDEFFEHFRMKLAETFHLLDSKSREHQELFVTLKHRKH